MWNKIKNIFNFQQGGTILGFTQFVAAGITAIFTIFAAPLLGPENLGIVSYFLAIAAIGFTISSFGVANILLVYLSKGIKLFSTMSFLVLISAAITGIVVFFIFNEISIVIVIIGHVIFELAIHELLAKQMYKKYMKYFLTQRIIFIIFGLPAFFLFDYTGFILVYGLSMFPSIIRIYFGFKESRVNFTLVKERVSFVANNYALYLARVLFSYVDRLIIVPLFGYAILGNYELAMQGVLLGNVFSVFLYNYLLPKDARKERTDKLKIYAIGGSIAISIFIIFVSPYILPLLFPEFQDAVNLIPIMGLSIVPHVFVTLYMSKFLASENTKIILISSVIHFATLVSAILILAHYYGTLGLIIGFILGEIVEALFLMVMHKKTFKSLI